MTLQRHTTIHWCLFFITIWLSISCTSTPPIKPSTQAYPQADQLFHQNPKWMGGDAAISVPLSKDRILWLFGDSFIATSPSNQRDESVLVRNSIGIQNGSDPRNASMSFYWQNPTNSKPQAFFQDHGNDPHKNWYWPGNGYRIENGPLLIFLYDMKTIDAPPPFNFKLSGYSVAVIDNPDSTPSQWNINIKHAPPTHTGYTPAAALIKQDNFLIALSITPTPPHAATLVRYPINDIKLGNTSSAQWWLGKELGWVNQSELNNRKPAVVIDDAAPESSLHYDANTKQYIHVASYGFGQTTIGIRTAPTITGPWSKPTMIYTPPEGATENIFVYAAKAHPELTTSHPNELLITYATNSLEWADIFKPENANSLYFPQFIITRQPAQP